MRIQINRDARYKKLSFYIRDITEGLEKPVCVKLYQDGSDGVYSERGDIERPYFSDETIIKDYSVGEFMSILTEAMENE